MKWLRRMLIGLIVLAVLAGIYHALQPQPQRVDMATVSRGPLQVTVDEDGKTRIKERYVVSAPVAGRLARIGIDPGDPVSAQDAPVATLEPSDPQLLNPRELAAAEARERAAEAALQRADPVVKAARADVTFAESELARKRELHQQRAASDSVLQSAELAYRSAVEALRSASFNADIARFELQQAKAALMPARAETEPTAADWQFQIKSPIDGRVLRVFQESAAVVTPGAPLIEVGDPTDLELEIDVLSSDAVQIRPGNEVWIEHWGGDQAEVLKGNVRLVEPSAFTKVSALGVEEQRVNVIIDLLDPVQQRASLGDGFRVEVRIVIWQQSNVLQVPVNSLFRDGDDWMVFVVRDGVARRQPVQLGHRNTEAAEVLDGLQLDDAVIVHPSDQISDGVSVVQRE